mgnify:CR=1 FL=1
MNSLAKVIEEMRTSVNDIKLKYNHLEGHVIKEIRGELEVSKELELEEGASKPCNFVHNTDTKNHHEVGIAQEAPLYWRARCGWAFGVTRFI